MVQLIEELRDFLPFQVVWARPHESRLQAIEIQDVVILSPSFNQMPRIVSESTFTLMILNSQNPDVLTAVAPTKVAEFFACGVPVLINCGVGDLEQQIKDYSAGLVFDPRGNVREQLLRFAEIVVDPSTPANCRRLAEEMYSMEGAVMKYQRMYDKLLVRE